MIVALEVTVFFRPYESVHVAAVVRHAAVTQIESHETQKWSVGAMLSLQIVLASMQEIEAEPKQRVSLQLH